MTCIYKIRLMNNKTRGKIYKKYISIEIEEIYENYVRK